MAQDQVFDVGAAELTKREVEVLDAWLNDGKGPEIFARVLGQEIALCREKSEAKISPYAKTNEGLQVIPIAYRHEERAELRGAVGAYEYALDLKELTNELLEEMKADNS